MRRREFCGSAVAASVLGFPAPIYLRSARAALPEQPVIYLDLTHDRRNGVDQLEKMVADPDVEYTATPVKVMAFVEFMHRVGRIKRKPTEWRDLFFPEAHTLAGS